MSLPVSIDSMKSTINRRGGIARPNRFGVYITHPSKSMNSLLQFNPATLLSNLISGDGVNAGDFISDPRDMFILCRSVTLPGKRISTTEATHNHHMSKKPYGAIADEVTMNFMLTNDYYIRKYFDMWQEMIVDTTSKHYKTFYKNEYCTDVTIQQLSSGNDIVPGYSLILQNAYPIQVGAIELSSEGEGLLEVSVTFEYDNYRSVGVVDGFSEVANHMLGIGRDTLDTFKRLF